MPLLPATGRALPIAAILMAGLILAPAPSLAGEQAKRLAASQVLRAVVGVRAEIPLDARTARSLGTEREGSGVLIDRDGLVLTIGYLILEASAVAIVGPGGGIVRAEIVAYDHDTGFGLLRARRPLDVEPLKFGDSSALAQGAPVLAVSHAGPRPVTAARVASRRVFAGYWEYLLEDAIFTVPPHPFYGGAALIGADGRLLGIGSLLVSDAAPEPHSAPGNMFVPIDGLKPILKDLVARGRAARQAHPWLGIYTNEAEGRVFITRLATGGPGEQAGLKPGDIIIGIAGDPVRGMADFLRKVWARGDAGATVPLDILHLGSDDMAVERVEVRSADRYEWLKLRGGL